jgi:isopentenyl-diphosphate Delta-isomerase
MSSLSSRKSEHIQINLEKNVQHILTTGLENYHFVHQALPEIDMDEIDLTQELFKKRLKIPVLISSMTGGTPKAASINQILAQAAQECGAAMGVGSQRVAIEEPGQAYSFQIRKYAPNILLFANLGAVQLNYNYTIDQCRQTIEMIEADALILHLNPLQEALQTGGNTRFAGLLKKIEKICQFLEVPVIVKEVGWGISKEAAIKLKNAGVGAIDVAGAGGTSWSQVEMYQAGDVHQANIAKAFQIWGIPTSEAVQQVANSVPELPVFASGGLKDGVDIAKCIALGAVLGGLAGPFLRAAAESIDAVRDFIDELRKEIKICMFAAGVKNMPELKQTPLLFRKEH